MSSHPQAGGEQDAVATARDHRADGRDAAAVHLVHARGGSTHTFVEFGEFNEGFSETYFSHHGLWCWQAHSDPNPRFADRDAWYAAHVAHREVLPVLKAAVSWLRAQPEL